MASSSGNLILRLVSASVAVANRAGIIIRDVLRKGELGIVDKGVNDLQTEADRSAQRCIVASLSSQFPHITIIGEENLDDEVNQDWIVTDSDEKVLKEICPTNLSQVKEEDVVVWVDPLDGTQEYTQGFLDHVTVLIGVAVGGKAIGGVIHQPYYNYKSESVVSGSSDLGRTIWGVVGLGVYGYERREPPNDRRIVTTTRSHSTAIVREAIDALKPDEVIKIGGAGHKVLLVLEGKAHAYVFASKGCKKWDTCAPEAVLSSAGGRLTDVHGNNLRYDADVQHMNSAGIIATHDASTHDWYVQRIPQTLRSILPETEEPTAIEHA